MPRPSVADPYQDLLTHLDTRYRDSLVRRLAQGFYENWRPTRAELAALIQQETGHAPVTPIRPSGRHPIIPVFEVDCGQLVPGYRLIARSVCSAGLVRRNSDLCQLVFLNYDLQPLDRPGQQPDTSTLTAFSGAITCIPDIAVPSADGDGQRQHAVNGSGVTGTCGPWPIAGHAQRVGFVISPQPTSGEPAHPGPAGTLLVLIGTGRAAWCPADSEPFPAQRVRPAGQDG